MVSSERRAMFGTGRVQLTLYIVRATKTGLTKIGISDSFDARLSKLRREGPDELEVLKTFHGDADSIESLEQELHAELAGYCDHHEWFSLPDAVLEELLTRLEKQFSPENYVADLAI